MYLKQVIPGATKNKAAIGLVLATLLILLVRIRFGYAAASCDEGFYLSSTNRYHLGDRPFVDEHFTEGIHFDLINYAISSVVPLDTIIHWRTLGLLLSISAVALAGAAARRELRAPLSQPLLLVLLAAACFMPYNLWTPNYKNLCITFVMSALALGLWSQHISSKIFRLTAAVACGFSWVLASTVYLPQTGLGVLFIGLLYARERLVPSAARTASVVTVTLFTLSAAAFAALYTSDNLHYVVENLLEKQRFPQYAVGIIDKIVVKFTRHGLFTHIATAIAVGCLLGVAARLNRPRVWYAAVVANVLFTIVLLFRFVLDAVAESPGYLGTLSNWLYLFNLQWSFAGLSGVIARCREAGGVKVVLLSTPFLVMGLGAGAICAVSASTASAHISEMNVASGIIWIGIVGAFLWMERTAFPGTPGWGPRVAWDPTTAFSAGAMAFSVVHLWSWTYSDVAPWRCDAEFASGRAAGIRSTAPEVSSVQSALRLIDQTGLTGTGDFLIVYPGRCEMYYMTGTRPALFTSILGRDQPPDSVMRRWLVEATNRGRIPRIAVATKPLSGGDALEEFLLERFSWPPGQKNGRWSIGVRKY